MKPTIVLLLSSAVLAANISLGQSHVTTDTLKYPLLEEGTGTWCTWCPGGSQVIQQTIEPTHPRAICVAFHNNDTMMLAGDPFNSVYIGGYPSATIDRVTWIHVDTAMDDGREYWLGDVFHRELVPPTFRVDMTSWYDSSTRHLNITVSGTALSSISGQYNINAYIVEDSISSAAPAYQQHSAYFDDSTSYYFNQCIAPCSQSYPCISCAILPDSVYAHMGVVRKILAAGGSIFGDSAFTNPMVGATAAKTYNYTIPVSSSSKFIKVVGFVQKYGATIDDRIIQNAIVARVKLMTSGPLNVAAINTVGELEVFPRPSHNNVHVSARVGAQSETKVIITNLTGHIVSEHTYTAGNSVLNENISLSNVPDGMYLLTVINSGERVATKILIAK